MSNIVINNTSLQVIEHTGMRVVTLTQIDAVHKRPEGTARRNFNANKRHLIEGEDFCKISANEFRTRFPGILSERASEDVTLMFETGYLMLVKSFTDDLAWSVQRQLTNNYFRAKSNARELSKLEVLQQALESEQARIKAEEALALAAPKVVYADAMTNADGSVLVRDAAKTIGVPVRKLEKALRDKRVILSDNAPAAKYVAQGYFVESLGHYETNTRGRQISRTPRVTGKGLEFLRRFTKRHAEIFAAAPKNVTARPTCRPSPQETLQ